ncbi:hypothetical protein CLAFUW4_03827 [Fulvia fulva]|uniref:CSD domain-containing protein n=1 Tax=Passalora fulva TaxID=5499 RepID=A0A9Q8LB60_PASFU|nr:uncharacterized protein CLAFUR5_03799 [Fulvia fulva]KAK4632282.1 hypothetical protein CLAFUR4_03815 [Fulvia fulva]KAK4633371.1 hypothetical protein CLAFUR0_03814 [Fulvia fulva]UJO14140.1 hypothetical protein CLAFUR5_03799 [Fulvia fulva]WPV11244.1 hypothetical protein CLAFUW4_03827 [Fulvia fulva]WPV26728.1 hypothetical protein CLAFUW7_03819 [Fulvia fulva]
MVGFRSPFRSTVLPQPSIWARNRDLILLGAVGLAVVAFYTFKSSARSGNKKKKKKKKKKKNGRGGFFDNLGRKLGGGSNDGKAHTTSQSSTSSSKVKTSDLNYGVVVSFDDEAGHGLIRPMGVDVGKYVKVYRSGLVETDTMGYAFGNVRTLRSGQRVEYVLGKGERAKEVRVLRYKGGRG